MQPKELELNVRIELRQPRMGGGGIALSEEAILVVPSFLEAAKILGLFHDLVEQLKKQEK